MDQDELARHTHQLDAIRARYDKGDGLYGRETVRVLLLEIQELSERLVERAPRPEPDHSWLEMKSIREGWTADPTKERA